MSSVRRRLAAALLSLTVAAPVTAATAPATAEVERRPARVVPADRPFVGFAIPRTRQASSGWIGARRVRGEVVVYRTDPRRTATTRAFAGVVTTRSFRVSGGGRVGRARTSCAALLLGRYGVPPRSTTRRERRLQAAAVDVAVQHLLAGGGFRHDGAAQRRRTDQRRNGPLIRAYAEKLLTEGCPQAGPYTVTLSTSAISADVGERVDYTATVRSRADEPVAGVDLVVTRTDGPPPTVVTTDELGLATFSVVPRRSGPASVTTVARGLPPTQVRVLLPRARDASRVVQAGLRLAEAYERRSRLAVQGQPRLSLTSPGPVRPGRELRLRFTLSASYPGPRPATVAVFGPLERGDDRGCRDSSLLRQRRVTVRADGTYLAPPISLTRRGRYVWRVSVAGDTYNEPVTRCGGGFPVR
ncbi:MAG: hypothetical protein JWN84_3742 [Nocardioides sp.]|nr:hypothetical protein [Nocardioides sp.]